MALLDDFNTAIAQSKDLPKLSNEVMLDLYALYKQTIEGDLNEPRPAGFDFKAIAKHDAWHSKKGKTKGQAMEEYIALVNTLSKESK